MDEKKTKERQRTSVGAQYPESSHEAGLADGKKQLEKKKESDQEILNETLPDQPSGLSGLPAQK